MLRKSSIAAALFVAAVGAPAHADEPAAAAPAADSAPASDSAPDSAPAADSVPAPAAAPAPSAAAQPRLPLTTVAQPTPPPPPLDAAAYAELSDDELIALAEASGELIVVWDERPEKPFERDTTVRLTDADLRARGVTHLGDALSLLPDITIRSAGRGGQQVDIRGARKAGVRVLVDGVALEDPFYGTFDVTTIPVTDVVQIRVAASPASPLDGPGGPGGVIEVHTRDAVGERVVAGHASGNTLPTAGASSTGRGHLARDLGLRISLTGTLGDQEYTVPGGAIEDDQHYVGGAARLEWRPARQAFRRAVVDVAGFDRAYLVPPAEEASTAIILIDAESGARASAGYEDRIGKVQLAARGFGYVHARHARYFRDATLAEQTDEEDLSATRAGGSLLVNRALGKTMQLVGAAHLITEDARTINQADMVTEGRSTVSELAGGWQYEDGRVRVAGAAGAAIPVGVGEAPWPEAKLVVEYAPVRAVAITATGARKGRLPTLRERYQVGTGNADLDPEHVSFGELKVRVAPSDRFAIEGDGWARRQSGLIQLDPDTRMLANLGEVDFVGADLRADVSPIERLTITGAWAYVVASDGTGEPPLDYLPPHKLMGQVRGVPHDAITATARVHWVDERIDRMNVLPFYTNVEAELTWAPTARWLVAARGSDLLDQRWHIHAGIPSPGRTFMLSVQGELR